MVKRRIQSLLQRSLGLQAYLFLFGLYTIATWRWAEPAFFRFLSLIPEEGVLLDIGANLGVTTTLLARRFPKAKIVAFEPVPWNAANIKRMVNLFRLRNVSIEKCAIGNRDDPVNFVIPIVSGARMHALGHLSSTFEEGEQLRVSCCKLDDLDLSHVTAVKLDVENSEHAVLSGGVQMLRRWRPVIYCELWDNENRQKSFELLGSLGYVPYTVYSSRLVPFDHDRGQVQYFIFLPRP
jgi:FkbM family methyltransferase